MLLLLRRMATEVATLCMASSGSAQALFQNTKSGQSNCLPSEERREKFANLSSANDAVTCRQETQQQHLCARTSCAKRPHPAQRRSNKSSTRQYLADLARPPPSDYRHGITKRWCHGTLMGTCQVSHDERLLVHLRIEAPSSQLICQLSD